MTITNAFSFFTAYPLNPLIIRNLTYCIDCRAILKFKILKKFKNSEKKNFADLENYKRL